MNRKKLFYTISVFLLVLLALVYWGWGTFLAPDETLRENLKQEMGTDFFELSEYPLNSNEEEGSSESSPELQPDPSNPAAAASLESITTRHRQRLDNLEQTVIERLEVLSKKAMSEYTELRMLGTDDKTGLARKYIQAFRMMEEAIDKQFNTIMAEMEAELKANQYDTSILSELEDHYRQKRRDLKSYMMEQVKQM
jgi:hypothetical protein